MRVDFDGGFVKCEAQYSKLEHLCSAREVSNVSLCVYKDTDFGSNRIDASMVSAEELDSEVIQRAVSVAFLEEMHRIICDVDDEGFKTMLISLNTGDMSKWSGYLDKGLLIEQCRKWQNSSMELFREEEEYMERREMESFQCFSNSYESGFGVYKVEMFSINTSDVSGYLLDAIRNLKQAKEQELEALRKGQLELLLGDEDDNQY